MSEENKATPFPLENPDKFGDVITVPEKARIEPRDEDGKPICCGQQMRVKASIIGPDYARCRECKKEIMNLASPHINNGIVWNEEVMETHGKSMWTVRGDQQ